mgnify:CR=1 FL=1
MIVLDVIVGLCIAGGCAYVDGLLHSIDALLYEVVTCVTGGVGRGVRIQRDGGRGYGVR